MAYDKQQGDLLHSDHTKNQLLCLANYQHRPHLNPQIVSAISLQLVAYSASLAANMHMRMKPAVCLVTTLGSFECR